MKLEKAIEIKEQYQYILQDASLPELTEADNLSIEALKRIFNNRATTPGSNFIPLPGETED